MEDLKKEFIPYELAIKLKKLGFDKPCLIYYLDDVNNTLIPARPYHDKCESDSYPTNKDLMENWASAPTFYQAFRFFREKGYDAKVQKESVGLYFGFYWTGAAWVIIGTGTYEEAELACLNKLVEIVESKSE